MAVSGSANSDTAFHRFAERIVFGNRALILLLFGAATLVLLYFAAQLRVDAGFKKQIPLQHEFMRTFLDYEAEFGGANRVLVAVMDRSGNMFNVPFMQTMEKITNDIIALDAIDDARVRSHLHPERALHRGRGGRLRGRQRDPGRVHAQRRGLRGRARRLRHHPIQHRQGQRRSAASWPRTSPARWSGANWCPRAAPASSASTTSRWRRNSRRSAAATRPIPRPAAWPSAILRPRRQRVPACT